MLWRGRRESDQIEDRRGMPVARGGLGIGGTGLLVVLALSLLTGQNPLDLLQVLSEAPQVSTDPGPTGPTGAPADDAGRFVAVVLGSTEDVWQQAFADRGSQYRKPTLVLFS